MALREVSILVANGVTEMEDSAGDLYESSSKKEESEAMVLSPEEQQIMALIVAGYTNKEIARHFSLSESTVYRRTARIVDKLAVSNRIELVLFVLEHHLHVSAPRSQALMPWDLKDQA
jgi:DNA-binding NarL/FixJ family response regulator